MNSAFQLHTSQSRIGPGVGSSGRRSGEGDISKTGKELTPCSMGNLGWKENVLPVSTVGQRDSALAEGKLWWMMP